MVGILYWMVLEVVLWKEYGLNVDIWSLGILVIGMLFGLGFDWVNFFFYLEMFEGELLYFIENLVRVFYFIVINGIFKIKDWDKFLIVFRDYFKVIF